MSATNGEAKSITKTEAAKMLGVALRTVSRMVVKRELQELPNGRISLEEIQNVLDMGVVAGGAEEKRHRVMTDTVEHLQKLVGMLVREIKGPLETANKANAKIVKQLMKENKRNSKAQLQTYALLGKVLMKKEERDTERAMAQQRMEMLGDAFKDVRKAVPQLMEQVAGKNVLKSFVEDLAPEEGAALWMLADGFEAEGKEKQAKRLRKILKAAGLAPPGSEEPPTEAETVEETPPETPAEQPAPKPTAPPEPPPAPPAPVKRARTRTPPETAKKKTTKRGRPRKATNDDNAEKRNN